MNYEKLIDPAHIATLVACLRHPRRPIRFVLHVRERALLAPLAAQLTRAMRPPDRAARGVLAVVKRHLQERSVLLSTRPSRPPFNAQVAFDLATISAAVRCEVIFLPPFCLAYTPGLFASARARQTVVPGLN